MMATLISLFRAFDYFVKLLGYYLMKVIPDEIVIIFIFVLEFIILPVMVFYGIRVFFRKPRKTRFRIASVVLGILTLIFLLSHLSRAYHSRPLVFDGESTKLTRTQIVPTLDTPLQPGKNAIWCASFQAAWKTLQSDITKGPVQLKEAEDTCARLNESPTPEVPEGALYTAAGWAPKGIIDKIKREKATRFPGSSTPDFSEAAPDSFVTYGYLETACKFSIPYFDSIKPLTFTDSAGNITQIRTFGIRGMDESKYLPLRKQIKVLVACGSLKERPEDFVVDLSRDSKDTQVVFARVPVGGSLKDILAAVEADIAMAPKDDPSYDEFGINSVLLVPEIAYRIVHEFDDLKTHAFLNESLAGQRMDIARQDVMFLLDRSGTELLSESSAIAMCVNSHAIGDKPFLVYLKKREAALPYFVMWVDNSEMLMKWAST